MLLQALVELTLDPATVGIGRRDESLPRSTQLLDLEAQPVDRFLERVTWPQHPMRRGAASCDIRLLTP